MATARAALEETSEAPRAAHAAPAGSSLDFLSLAELEKQHILAALEKCHGNRTHAAKLLDISIRTLRNKLHEYSGNGVQSGHEDAAVGEG